ncbi:MAG: tRNA (adenosine(37)-N6)-threonylcarbamoyltransferase complex dimerization subunit type 1 TsaB [Propionibacteriaceae bacterium]|nr:tRNA (adenosine(37)-N6)-threonylcarbamoyltransferase complex dimerization subunit type 1 TsaB [Propionibacteriaceae bacterium]
MALTLGIDTATVVCVGLAQDGEILANAIIDDSRAHVEQLMPLVNQVLADAGQTLSQITQIAVGTGPGPFTGLRVGVAAAITLGIALDVEVFGVCTLDVLARQVKIAQIPTLTAGQENDYPKSCFVVATDARRKEVYWATYSPTYARLENPAVTKPTQVPLLPVCGPATLLYQFEGGNFNAACVLDAGVLAAHVAQFLHTSLEPLYLRRPDAEVPTSRKSVLPKPRITGLKSGQLA